MARAAGIVIDWTDFADLSAVVPLLTRVYPNGSADVNQFQAAGGPGFVLRELLHSGCLHPDVTTVSERGISAYGEVPALEGERLRWSALPAASGDTDVVRTAAEPFSATGGLKLLRGNLGRAVIKTSAVPDERHVVEAPARVFTSQEALLAAFNAGELQRDLVVVVRFQGPHANGMPELHKLTPPLAVLQGQGFKVALVSLGEDGLTADHLPLEFDAMAGEYGTLLGHVARANPLWRVAAGTPVLVVFGGPQAYVSPSWYPSKAATHKVVPTWNYTVVHAHGVLQAVEDAPWLEALVGRLTDHHEAPRPAPWAVDDAPADYVQQMLRAIVGIRIPLTRLVGKWKVSQNRSEADRLGVADGLGDDPMAALVRRG